MVLISVQFFHLLQLTALSKNENMESECSCLLFSRLVHMGLALKAGGVEGISPSTIMPFVATKDIEVPAVREQILSARCFRSFSV